MKLFYSIRLKIIALASIPVFLVAIALATAAYLEVTSLGQDEINQVREQMMVDRKRELK